MQKYILPGYLLFSALAAYGIHLFLKSRIDPRRSAWHLILYLLLHLLAVAVTAYVSGLFFYRVTGLHNT